MVDFVVIIGAVAVSVLFVGVSLYIFIVYCHRNLLFIASAQDKGIGSSIFGKVLIILGQSLAWGQLMLVTLDIAVQDSALMEVLYSAVYVGIFAMTVIVMPFTSAIYESDEQDSWPKRICHSAIYTAIIALVWSAFTFISYIFLSVYTDSNDQQQRISVPFYMMLTQAIVGWILLVINGSIGLSFLPYDLIEGFTKRPKKITKQQALQLKQDLQNRSDQLIEEGQKLINQDTQFKESSASMNWFARKKKQSGLKDLLNKFKKQVIELEDDHSTFQNQLHISEQSPLIPFLKLFGGILSIFISIVWIIQLFGATMYIEGKPVLGFLDPIMQQLLDGAASFAATIIFGLMMIYMQICLIKGNTVFGIKIPYVIAFHPLQLNKTYLNSLLFNVSMMMLCSLSITQMGIIAFPRYLSSSYLFQFYSQQVINKLEVFGFLMGDRIYTIVFLCLSGLAIIFLIIRKCRERKRIQRGKVNKDG